MGCPELGQGRSSSQISWSTTQWSDPDVLRRRRRPCHSPLLFPVGRRRACAGGVGWSVAVVVIEGPRFSTRAESQWYAAQGWSVVNMTGHRRYWPRELAVLHRCLVTDLDAGVDAGDAVTQEEVFSGLRQEHRANARSGSPRCRGARSRPPVPVRARWTASAPLELGPMALGAPSSHHFGDFVHHQACRPGDVQAAVVNVVIWVSSRPSRCWWRLRWRAALVDHEVVDDHAEGRGEGDKYRRDDHPFDRGSAVLPPVAEPIEPGPKPNVQPTERGGRRQAHPGWPHAKPGNHSAISRTADSPESEPCTRFSDVDRARSPRIEPGAALRPSVAPFMPGPRRLRSRRRAPGR